MLEMLITFMMSLAMMVGVWLVLRRPILWYFRINETIENQQKTIDLLQSINEKLSGGQKQPKKKETGHNHPQTDSFHK